MPKKYLGPWKLIFSSPKENLRTHLLTKHWINAGKVSIGDGMGMFSQHIWFIYGDGRGRMRKLILTWRKRENKKRKKMREGREKEKRHRVTEEQRDRGRENEK